MLWVLGSCRRVGEEGEVMSVGVMLGVIQMDHLSKQYFWNQRERPIRP